LGRLFFSEVAVEKALEAAGVEFLNHGQPGVRLRAKYPTMRIANPLKKR
jgi:hypothetical protein